MGRISPLGGTMAPAKENRSKGRRWRRNAKEGRYPCRRKVREGDQVGQGSMWHRERLLEPLVAHTS